MLAAVLVVVAEVHVPARAPVLPPVGRRGTVLVGVGQSLPPADKRMVVSDLFDDMLVGDNDVKCEKGHALNIRYVRVVLEIDSCRESYDAVNNENIVSRRALPSKGQHSYCITTC